MNAFKAIGLGEPEIVGKKLLFQPPQNTREHGESEKIEQTPLRVDQRVRMTLEITKRSLSIIQECQSRYRLDTGHPLPKWKIIGEALELYEKMRKGEGNEK